MLSHTHGWATYNFQFTTYMFLYCERKLAYGKKVLALRISHSSPGYACSAFWDKSFLITDSVIINLNHRRQLHAKAFTMIFFSHEQSVHKNESTSCTETRNDSVIPNFQWLLTCRTIQQQQLFFSSLKSIWDFSPDPWSFVISTHSMMPPFHAVKCGSSRLAKQLVLHSPSQKQFSSPVMNDQLDEESQFRSNGV